MKVTVSQWIRDQRTLRKQQPPVANADLSGQTVLGVGDNTGIGLEAVKHFAKMNAGRIILACRNEAKGKAAIESKYAYRFIYASVGFIMAFSSCQGRDGIYKIRTLAH